VGQDAHDDDDDDDDDIASSWCRCHISKLIFVGK
jgi:hypothetical protein